MNFLNTVGSRSSLPYHTPPAAVTAISTAGVINSAFQLNWTSSSNVDIYKNGTLYQSNVSGQSAFIMNLTPSTSYTFGLSKTGDATILKTANITTPATISLTNTYTRLVDASDNNQGWSTLINYNGSVMCYANYIGDPITLNIYRNSTWNIASVSISRTSSAYSAQGTMNYLGNFIYYLGGNGTNDATYSNKCYYSTDYGATWTSQSISPISYAPKGDTSKTIQGSIKCNFTGQKIYVISELSNGNLYYSQDYGLTYTLIKTGIFTGTAFYFPCLNALPDFSHIVVWGQSSSTIAANARYGLYRPAVDVSFVWNTISVTNIGLNSGNIVPLIDPSTKYTYLAFVGGNAFYVIDNNGNYLSTISPTLSISTIYWTGTNNVPDSFCASLDLQQIIGCIYDNAVPNNYGIWRSTNKTTSFTALRRYPGNAGYGCFAMAYDGSVVLFYNHQTSDPQTSPSQNNSMVMLK